jgi:transposase
MSRSLFWLSDKARAAIEPHLPKNQPGARRVDDRRAISGIIHMLKCGGRSADGPSEYGPSTTVYNHWNRWSRRGVWTHILAVPTEEGWIAETGQIDSSYIKAHRSPGGAKRGAGQCHWHLAWRPDDEDPRACRCPAANTGRSGSDRRLATHDRQHQRSRPRLGSGRKRGAGANALGRSRGGFTSKIHARCDNQGLPVGFILTGGEASDDTAAEPLMAIPVATPKALLADKPVLRSSKGAMMVIASQKTC